MCTEEETLSSTRFFFVYISSQLPHTLREAEREMERQPGCVEEMLVGGERGVSEAVAKPTHLHDDNKVTSFKCCRNLFSACATPARSSNAFPRGGKCTSNRSANGGGAGGAGRGRDVGWQYKA